MPPHDHSNRSLPAVILAAGDGGRLEHLTASAPKALVRVAGRPLIAYTLDAITANDITETVVVTGYRESELRTALRESPLAPGLRFASNPHFREGSARSLAAARSFVGDRPFLLLMADHLFSSELVRSLLAAHPANPSDASFVAADAADAHGPTYVAEATHLQIADGAVTAIGKGLVPFNGLDTGAFLFGPAVWQALDALPPDSELSAVCRQLIRRHQLRAVDVSGSFWYDVDTPEDLAAAESLLAGRVSA